MSTTAAPATTGVTDPYANLGLSTIGQTPNSKTSQTESADRFLKMLVAQMQNQDPLNPMDNAQVTSQMAQINAVAGLDKVNESVKSLNTQLLQMQALQGAALVGREVAVSGNELAIENGVGRGAVVLEGKATAVKVEMVDASKNVVGTLNLGAQDAGRVSFQWPADKVPSGAGITFRVTAGNGRDAVAARTLMLDRVQSVSTAGDTLSLNLLRSGNVAADQVVSFD